MVVESVARTRTYRRATQRDVARLAGVSQATVSKALGGQHAAVPAATLERVLAAAEQVGYRVDGTARNLRRQRTETLAALIPDITNPFYPALVRGIQEVADREGYNVVTYNTDGHVDKELRFVEAAQTARVDGLIVTPFHLTSGELQSLVTTGTAVVVIGRVTDHPQRIPLDCVYVDHPAGAGAVIDHLVDRGHERIGLLAGESDNLVGLPRRTGFLDAMRRHGIKVDESSMVESPFTEEGGYQAAQTLFDRNRPTALAAANDLIAFGALRALRERGLRVPEDVALTGFDDIPAARLVTPALTTVSQFQGRIGTRAAELIITRLRGEAPDHGVVEELPFELTIREST